MFPRYILSDNSTEFKNHLLGQVLKQLGIERIFSAPYHLQSNQKLEVFHKYLKPTLKKLYEKDLATAEMSFFLVYRRDPNLPLHQLLEPMQWFWEIHILDYSTLKLTDLP